jgi:hypothetical protein
MAGLVPAIHVLLSVASHQKSWMPGTRPGMTDEKLVETWMKKILLSVPVAC